MATDIPDSEAETIISRSDRSGTKLWRQILAGFIANLAMFNNSLAFSWPAPSLPQLMDKSSDVYLTSDQAAWVASALMMGACFGPIASALLVNVIGRKWFLYTTAIPHLICSILTYTAQSYEMLFTARFITGLGVGASFSVLPMYLAEIAETRIRGALGTMSYTLFSLASLMAYSIGPWTSWKFLAAINAIPAVLFLLLFPWMPETPYFYIIKNSTEAATKSLIWLRGTESVSEELKEMTDYVETERKQRGRIYELITVPTNRRAFLIVVILLTAQQACGLGALVAYISLIFRNASSEIDPSVAMLITGAVGFVANIMATYFVDRLGRKPLVLTSSIGTAVCSLVLALYFNLENSKIDVKFLYWLPLLLVILFYVFFYLGLAPMPYTILAEIFPTSVKAWAATVISIYGSLLGVLVTKIYQVTVDALGQHVIFYIFGICELLTAVLIFLLLPETKGKSFKEIQDTLLGSVPKAKSNDH